MSALGERELDAGDLVARWARRQQRLVARLRELGAEHHDYRLDVARGLIWWLPSRGGEPTAVARSAVLGSWALSSGSILAAWENRSLPDGASVPAVASVPARLVTRDEQDAWCWAWLTAEGAGAEFVYRASTPQSWIFVGLWEVRGAAAGERPDPPDAPWAHVAQVLAALVELGDHEARVLTRNYGRGFIASPAHGGTPFEAPLQAIGRRMLALAEEPPARRREGTLALLALVRARMG
jgi:hypothetical protein